MCRILFYVGGGSCIGGIARYLFQQYIQNRFPSSIPLGTLSVNILGSFIIGVVYALADKAKLLSPEIRILLATGFCGGFTTFSSFTYENIKLLEDGELFYTAFYVLLSVSFGFLAVWLGILFIKLIF